MNNSIDFQKRHQYFNDIYDSLHPSNNKETRVYTKPKQDFDFRFQNNELSYSKHKDLDFNKRSIDNFKTISEDQLDSNKMNAQEKISFYLTNNLVPVYILFIIERVLTTQTLTCIKKKIHNQEIYYPIEHTK
jgi:hypothetical protein